MEKTIGSKLKRFIPYINLDYAGYHLFYIAFALYCVGRSLPNVYWYGLPAVDYTINLMFLKILRYMAYLFCGCQIVMNVYRTKKFALYIATAAVFFMQYILCRNSELVTMLIVMIAANNADARVMIRISAAIKAFVLGTQTILCVMNIIYDYVDFADRERHYLGYIHVTASAYMMLFLIFEILYLKKHFTLKDALILFAANCFFSGITGTLTSMYYGIPVILYGMIAGRHPSRELKRPVKAFLYALPFLCFAATLFVFGIYDKNSEFWNMLEKKAFHGRLQMAHDALVNYPPSLLGHHPFWDGHDLMSRYRGVETQTIIDCSYINIYVYYGIIFTLFLLFLYSTIIWRALKLNDKTLAGTIAWILLVCLTEMWLFNPTYNIFPFLAMAGLKIRDEKKKIYYNG